jgi:hypothetical protein
MIKVIRVGSLDEAPASLNRVTIANTSQGFLRIDRGLPPADSDIYVVGETDLTDEDVLRIWGNR